MYWDWTYFLILPALLLSIYAQARVKGAYAKYQKVQTRGGLPAGEVAGDILRAAGNIGVAIEHTSGTLTDHYDPKTETLRLSDGVYGSSSVAALGIAAHEAGHAMQKYDDYAFLQMRTMVAPVVNIGSNLAFPIFLLGLIFSWRPIMVVGIALYTLVVIFTLVTLPVERDASRRAIVMLTQGGYITQDEEKGVRAVLGAAALTYVAAACTAILQLARLLLLASSRRRD